MGKHPPFYKNNGGELSPGWVITEHSLDFWLYNKLLIDLTCEVCASELLYFHFSARISARCARSVRTENVDQIFH